MVRLLLPANDRDCFKLNPRYQKMIDACIDLGRGDYCGIIKLISWNFEVTNFTLAEWIYIADRLRLRPIWIVPAWVRYTVRPRFQIERWVPCENILSLYSISNKLLFNSHIKYWTSDRDDALHFLDFAREYGEFYNVFRVVRADAQSKWIVEEYYRNYSNKDIVTMAITKYD
jgi:hypothetical protein